MHDRSRRGNFTLPCVDASQTGLNANKCARILHIWQAFVAAHTTFFVDKFGYTPVGKAGQRGRTFALFRDEILHAALRFGHVRSDVDATLSTMQERHIKRVACQVNGLPSARSIEGWELMSV